MKRNSLIWYNIEVGVLPYIQSIFTPAIAKLLQSQHY